MLTINDIPHRNKVSETPAYICFQRVIPAAHMQDTTPFWRRSAKMADAADILEWANADATDQSGNNPFKHCVIAFSKQEADNIWFSSATFSDEEIKAMGALNWV